MPNFKNQVPQASKTNAQQVRQQNASSAASAGGTQSANFEFATETAAQQVRQQNAASMAKKNQNQTQQ